MLVDALNPAQNQPTWAIEAPGDLPGTARPVRLLLVDNNALVKSLMRFFIERSPHHEVVGDAEVGANAVLSAARCRPDVIVLDLSSGGDGAIAFLGQLQVAAPEARILLVTDTGDVDLLQRAVRNGARGIVSKVDAGTDSLLKAINKVRLGELWLDRKLTATLINGDGNRNGAMAKENGDASRDLTAREGEVIRLLCAGLSNKVIGKALGISDITVRHHLTSVFAKLGVTGRVALVVYAQQRRLVSPAK